MARKDNTDQSGQKKGRLAQIRQTYQMTKRTEPHIGWLLLALFVGVLAIFVVIGLLLTPLWLWIVLGVPVALLVAATIFGRRAERSAYSQIEGQPGAAAAALGTLRRGWDVENAVGVNRAQDVVHRAVGRPGIVLVGEGTSHSRVANLLTQEKKRHARVSPDTPVHEVIIGYDDGQVPLRKLNKHVNKLPRSLRPPEVTELRNRLRALGTTPVGMPKGPLPKNARMPRGGGMPG